MSIHPRARWALAASLSLALGGWEPFRTADPDVEAGNLAYAQGRYDEALAAYDRAARRGGVDPDGLAFDRGTAELGKADATKDPAEKRRLTERAIEDLKQAAHSKDPQIRGGANYNRGNSLMAQDKLEEAIEAYKQALRDDPELDDARVNLELALRRRQKQQQQRQQQGQGQGQQGQQGQQGGQGQGQGQGQNGSGSPQSGSNGQGSNQPPDGSNGQGSNQNGSSGQGSNQNGSDGQGSNQQNGSNGQGSNQNGSDGQGSNQQDGSNGQGSNQPQNGSNDQSGQPGNGQSPRGRPQHGRATPRSPKTPAEGKLDDLDNYSRRLQKDQARRRATGRPSDPQHDW